MDSIFVYKKDLETVDYWTLIYCMTIINTSFESALHDNNSSEEFTFYNILIRREVLSLNTVQAVKLSWERSEVAISLPSW